MSEEWGEIILKGPNEILEKLAKSKGINISESLSNIRDFAGIKSPFFEREDYQFHTSYYKSGYLKLDYDCSEWSYIAAGIVREGKGVEVYGRCCNDDGVYRFFALPENAKKFMFSFGAECEDLGVEGGVTKAIEQVDEWVSRVPEDVKKLFPQFCTIDIPCLYHEEKVNILPQVNLYVRLEETTNIDQIEKILGNDYSEFVIYKYVDSQYVSGGGSSVYWEERRLNTMKLERNLFDTFNVGRWFSEGQEKPIETEKLIGLLTEASINISYVIEFYDHSSAPYKVLNIENNRLNTIFDSNDYSEEQLSMLNSDIDETLNMKVNWFCLEFEQIKFIHENYTLKGYVDKRLSELTEKI